MRETPECTWIHEGQSTHYSMESFKKNKKKIQTCLESKESENMAYLSLWGSMKAILRGQAVHDFHAYLKQSKLSQTINLIIQLKYLRKRTTSQIPNQWAERNHSYQGRN